MSEDRARDRRPNRRVFRPTLDGRLESKLLLSHAAALHAGSGRTTAGGYTFQTAFGGQVVEITAPDGGVFDVSVQGGGAIHARPAPGRRVDLNVFASSQVTVLVVDPRPVSHPKDSAHDISPIQARQDPLLHIRNINIKSGRIGQILGYHSADLSGAIIVTDTARVDRIAFSAILPGASIFTGGDLNTLDVDNGITLAGGPGIQVGRPGSATGDLNSLSVNQSVTLTGGSSLLINRDLGLAAQPAKGSGPAGQGAFINGDLVIGPGSLFAIGRSLDGQLQINGAVREPGAASITDRLKIPAVGPGGGATLRGGFFNT